jgi:putative restriction endonuclease
MNALEIALLTKIGYENGWETVLNASEFVRLGSARHAQEVEILPASSGWNLQFRDVLLQQEVLRHLNLNSGEPFHAENLDEVGVILLHAAELAMALPSQPLSDYVAQLKKMGEADSISQTEVEKLARQRVGQDLFRKGLMRYWQGRCSVTGIDLPDVLRASHAKPWLDCQSDNERLDIFNGFLLVANLDALFDRGLISFDEQGHCLKSNVLEPGTATRLGLDANTRLRWVANEHQPYLEWHRRHVFVETL